MKDAKWLWLVLAAVLALLLGRELYAYLPMPL